MSHEQFDERLSAYLDGELPPQERDEVEARLRRQPELSSALDQVRELGDGIRQLPTYSLSPDFADRVLAQAQRVGPSASAHPSPPRRGWLIVAAAALTATAALVLAMVAWNWQPEEVVQPQPPPLSPAERAVAAVLANADEGQAVIVRLKLTTDDIRGKALDRALSAAGISAAAATAVNPAAQETAQGYRALAAGSQGATEAADVLFIEADAEKLRKALAMVAHSPEGKWAISAGGVVQSTQPGLDRNPKAEGEGSSGSPQDTADRKNYAQHLPPRGFPVLTDPAQPPQVEPGSTETRPGAKPARVLIVVEVSQ